MRKILRCATPVLAAIVALAPLKAQSPRQATVDRLYVLDCGKATSPDFSQWSPGSHQGRPIVYSDYCYLIRHGADWMLWDTGVDDRVAKLPKGKEVAHKVRGIAGPTLAAQLKMLKVRPEDVTIIAFSHGHFDHVGNARLFPRARWLVQRVEHQAMFSPEAKNYGFLPEFYSSMKRNPTLLLDGDHDVFGDGAVRIISTPGHTPGHQSLFVRLPKSGPVLLSGDAVHSLENFEHWRVPTFNADPAATKRSIKKIESLLAQENAQLWVNHDQRQTASIPRAPDPVE